MRFTRWLYLIAGVYGLIVLPPKFFVEARIGQDEPPAITHPEFFYGFLGVAVAWQVAFLIMARDPQRYRPLMIPAIIEKFSFGIAAAALFSLGRTSATVFGFAMIDLLWGTLFVVAYRMTQSQDAVGA